MRRILFVYFFVFAMIVLTACSSSPAPVEFTVEMTEFAFTPNTFEVQVGQEVTFHLVNKGALDHEFMVGRNVMMMEGSPNGFEHNMFEAEEPVVVGGMFMGGEEEHDMEHSGMETMDHGFMVVVPKNGEEASVTFTPTEDMVGEWEIACFTDGGAHYNQGMTGKLVVAP